MAHKKYIWLLLLTLVFSCRNSDQNGGPSVPLREEVIGDIKENDTLPLSPLTPGLEAWLKYYQRSDPRFVLSAFRNSGVSLHFDDLDSAHPSRDTSVYGKYYRYSPDGNRFIDMFSYDHFIDKGILVGGDSDQELVIADATRGIRKQLMYNTPGRLAEWVDWLNNHDFLVGMTTVSEDGKWMGAQILLFRIKDSSYTNFDLDHRMAMDSILFVPKNFSETYLEMLSK